MWSDIAFSQTPADPTLVWRTIYTSHFDVHYHEPLGEVAQKVASVAESVNRALEIDLGYKLDERTQVIISDNSEWANGFAGVLPRNEIRLYVVSPDDMSPFSDYDDWMTTLITHEHTHELHLNQTGGIPAIINAVLGKTYVPNMYQPNWFTEGLATYEESAQTTGGRLRSSMFDMYLRMDALEGQLLRIDQLSHEANRWPHGNMAYLYGSRFVQFIASKYGTHALAQIGREYGRQALPYGLNRVAKRATGHAFIELYDLFLDKVVEHYREQQRQIIELGIVEGKALTHQGETAFWPRFLPDGRVVYYASDGRSLSQLRTTSGESIARVRGDASWTVYPNGRQLIYSNTAPYRDIYWFHDLFSYDMQSGERRRLTKGMRAKMPDVSPDGRQVAYVIESAGTSHLAVSYLYDIERTQRILLRNVRYEQVSGPRWSPDGRTIAASVWRRGGRRDIALIDVRTGRQTSLTDDRAIDTGPSWSPDGKWLYFSSDRTGVANIYAYDLNTGLVYLVTNVIGGAYQPAVSPDGSKLVYVGYRAKGYDIYSLRIDQTTFRPASPPLRDRAEPKTIAVRGVLPTEPYDPLPTLWPRRYRIDVAPDDFGYQVGVAVSGSDAVALHAYSASMAFSLDRLEPSFELSYSYLRWPFTPTATVYRRIGKREDLVVADEPVTWVENVVGATVGGAYDFPGDFYQESLGVSYSLFHVNANDPVKAVLDPRASPPDIPELGTTPSVRVSWRFSTIERQTYDISSSSGQSLVLSVGVTDPILGASYRSLSVNWSLASFFPMPWHSHHVLALRYTGGHAVGDQGHRQVFSVGGFSRGLDIGSISELVYTGMIPALGGEALRGYSPNYHSGLQFHLLQTEYRFPIWRIDMGLYTLPVYARRLYTTVFADYGDAFSERFDISTFRVGIGSEVLADLVIGYRIELTVRLGLARGLSRGGVTQFYFHFGFPF